MPGSPFSQAESGESGGGGAWAHFSCWARRPYFEPLVSQIFQLPAAVLVRQQVRQLEPCQSVMKLGLFCACFLLFSVFMLADTGMLTDID